MTADDRERIRQAVNTHRRTTLQVHAIANPCSRCGCHMNDYTPNCTTCKDRHYYRRRRQRLRTATA